jgi:multidrug efflux pump subunit AcrB
LRPSGTVLAFVPPILLNMVLITIIHFNSLVQPLAILLSVPSALVGVVLGLLITGVPLGLMTLLVALTRIVVRVLYSVVFGIRQESATSTEPTPTPQPSRT